MNRISIFLKSILELHYLNLKPKRLDTHLSGDLHEMAICDSLK